MKISLASVRNNSSAISLIECLIFMGVLSILLSLAFVAYGRFETKSKRLRQNASDIAQTIKAGELWREDIRSAAGKIRAEKDNGGTVLRIPHDTVDVIYTFRGSTVSRQKGGASVPLLTNVTSSLMAPVEKQFVQAWTWEVELVSRDKQPKLRPLFSFQAVVASK